MVLANFSYIMTSLMNEKITAQIKKAPQKTGIYIFSAKGGSAAGGKNRTGEFLYIGKAGNLKKRVRQYLRPDIERPFLKHLMAEAEKVDFKTTGSEIEALILESKLIKERQPKYNVMLRDGKRHFYVGFSNDDLPKVFIGHQPTKFGPFTDGAALRTAIRLLRRIFKYCTCKQRHNNFCLNYHIGKCPGYCCLKKSTNNLQLTTYNKNIRVIKEILSGKKASVVKKLKKELKLLAERQAFEKAIELRDKIEKLEKIFENAKILNDANIRIHTNDANNNTRVLMELKKTLRLPSIPKRIEGYDISNIQGRNAVGAMVVFMEGRPDKDEYRKFKIIFKKSPDDTAMLKEILLRRFNHLEWPKPDLLFIDGGRAQLNAAENAIADSATIISLAKGRNEVFSTTLKKPVPMAKLPPEVRNLILHIDSEAHRFAVSYYRKIHRRKTLE